MRGSNHHIEHQRKTVERVREAESDTTKVDGQSDVILDEDVQTVNDGMNLFDDVKPGRRELHVSLTREILRRETTEVRSPNLTNSTRTR